MNRCFSGTLLLFRWDAQMMYLLIERQIHDFFGDYNSLAEIYHHSFSIENCTFCGTKGSSLVKVFLDPKSTTGVVS